MSLALIPAYRRRSSTVPGGSAAGSARVAMRVAARKSVERRCTSIMRVDATGRPRVAQARSAGSVLAAVAATGISTAAAGREGGAGDLCVRCGAGAHSTARLLVAGRPGLPAPRRLTAPEARALRLHPGPIHQHHQARADLGSVAQQGQPRLRDLRGGAERGARTTAV